MKRSQKNHRFQDVFWRAKVLSIRDHVEWPDPLLGGAMASETDKKGTGLPGPGVAAI